MKLWSDLWSITSISVLLVSWLPTEAMETISPPMPHPVSPTIRVSGRQGTFLPLQLVPCLFLAKVSALNPSLFLYLDKWSYKGPCFYPSWQRPKAGAALALPRSSHQRQHFKQEVPLDYITPERVWPSVGGKDWQTSQRYRTCLIHLDTSRATNSTWQSQMFSKY